MSRKPHEPDDKTRKTVEAMSSYGIPQEDIAKVLEIDSKTLRKYYEYELATAATKATAQVAQRLYQKCMNDDTSSIIFWLKTRAKWAETVKQEVQPLDERGEPSNGFTLNLNMVKK
jgi:hypothetical protein